MPIPKEGESLEEAAERLIAHGPALETQDNVIAFTRIRFNRRTARVMAPPPLHPGAVIPYKNGNLVRIFEKYFVIK